MLRHYEVKEGDTLTGIASRFGVSMMTVWWANKLTTKAPPGRQGPSSSLRSTDSSRPPEIGGMLESLAAKNEITVAEIIATNELEIPT